MTMRNTILIGLLAALSCGKPTPLTPVVVEAGDASPCAVDEAITADRMVRTDSGVPLVLLPCPDSGR